MPKKASSRFDLQCGRSKKGFLLRKRLQRPEASSPVAGRAGRALRSGEKAVQGIMLRHADAMTGLCRVCSGLPARCRGIAEFAVACRRDGVGLQGMQRLADAMARDCRVCSGLPTRCRGIAESAVACRHDDRPLPGLCGGGPECGRATDGKPRRRPGRRNEKRKERKRAREERDRNPLPEARTGRQGGGCGVEAASLRSTKPSRRGGCRS